MAGTDGVSLRPVIIENQFGRSDHNHLGKLITYSANRDAGIIIWIANEFHLAHRKAVEWLDAISPKELSFYAVELEVLRIDESRPAVSFRLVAGPPPGRRREVTPSDQVSPRNRRYQEFFDSLRKRLLRLQPNFTKAKALPQSWWSLGVGRSGFSLAAAFTADDKFRIEVYIDVGVKEENEFALVRLQENKGQIEEKIGGQLHWDLLPDSRASRIWTAIDGSIDNRKKHQEFINWGAPMMVKFRQTLAPLVREIDFSTSIEAA